MNYPRLKSLVFPHENHKIRELEEKENKSDEVKVFVLSPITDKSNRKCKINIDLKSVLHNVKSENVYSTCEVAGLIGLKPKTIQALALKKRIKSVSLEKGSQGYRFKGSDIIEFVKSRI